MPKVHRKTRRRPGRPLNAGLGMVELLMALTISAMLLTSVAIAFQASTKTVEENQKITSATHNARIVLNRMMAEIRQAEAVDCEPNIVRIIPATFGSLTMTEYELDGNSLWYHQTIDGKRTSHAILAPEDGVTIHDFGLNYETGTDYDEAGDEYVFTARVTALLDISVGDNRMAVTTSTNPRRNLQW